MSTGLTSVREYHRLIEAGVLDEDDHVELIEGRIVEMTPQSEPHAQVITRLNRVLTRALPDDYEVRPQLPLTFDTSEPEPDLAVVDARHSADEHPRTAFLVIEVGVTSVVRDVGTKKRIYARADVKEYWTIDVSARTVTVHRHPDGDDYRSVSTHTADHVVSARSVPDVTVAVSSLFD